MNSIQTHIITRKNIDTIAGMLDELVDMACKKRASDIHIDPKQNNGFIRFRVDGLITDYALIEKELMAEVIGRIKVLSGLRGDVHDKSQDGRFYKQSLNTRVDIRVSIAPTYYGENAVLRLLTHDHQRVGRLTDLGCSEEQEFLIHEALRQAQGMIIVSGPTGAGKTSTLYSMLQHVCSGERAVVSLEDPVEYPLSSVRQIQLKSSQGYGFSSALRGVLRQDPDVVMVGEMRDKETAAVAVQVALTGHLIITSLHAEDAAHIIPRLIDMGIDPYLLAATVKVMIGQRLVRKFDSETGEYYGRVGLFEVMNVTDAMREAVMQKATAGRLKEVALREGYKTMQEDGVKKVASGITTEEELRRVLQN